MPSTLNKTSPGSGFAIVSLVMNHGHQQGQSRCIGLQLIIVEEREE